MWRSLLGGALLLLAIPIAANAHAELRKSTPAANATVAGSPAEIRLEFTKEIAEGGSTVTVTGPTGRVENGKPLVEPYVMRIGLKQMVAGIYRVDWHVMSADGHETQGSYSFTVKAR